jgi:hypothetical protein
MAGTLDSLFGGLRSYQTGAVGSGVNVGTGEDVRFIDVTVNSVNVLKTACKFDGGYAANTTSTDLPMRRSGSGVVSVCTIRMISSTTLRISTTASGNPGTLVGRWQITESN